MAYVPGYEFDIFVSYAHVDNAAIEPADHGWVDALIRILERDLGMKMGRSDAYSIWRDTQSLRGNHQITGHIPQQVKTSAVLLAVLSPGYLASKFCLQELQSFLERGDKDPSRRLFVICKDPIDESRQPLPEPLRDLRKYKFWIVDQENRPRVLGWPLPQNTVAQDRQFYYPKIGDIASDIFFQLEELRSSSSAAPPSTNILVAPQYQGNVLLAEVTDDIDARREEVRRYLNQQGLGALPAGAYHLARAEFERSFSGDLARCGCFVQLLGPILGKTPPDVPEGYGRLQYDLAKKRGARILQWRPPDLNLSEATSAAHVAFLRSDTVSAIPLEDFKRSIVDAMVRKEPAPVEKAPFLFVNAAPPDMEEAQAIVNTLDDFVEWEMPLYDQSASAEAVQNEIEPQLVDCDGLVVVHGKAGPRWVLSQLQQYRKLAPRRKKEPRLLAVVGATKGFALSIPIKLRGMATFEIADAARRIREAFGH